MIHPQAPKLDPRESHYRIPCDKAGLTLFLRHLPPAVAIDGPPKAVLYVHGATFPSALSIAHRFDGHSWRDELCAAGFDVWGLDFLGFGFSDRQPEICDPPDRHPPLGGAEDACRQIECAVRFILAHHGLPRLSIIAHSWGTIAACRFAGRCPGIVERLVLFGPIGRRTAQGGEAAPTFPAWRLITLQAQWVRFVEDVPTMEPPVLSRRHFEDWGERYLDSDPESRMRRPASVKTPAGPLQDIFDAWHGDLAYDPGSVHAPVAIIRGEWDSLIPDADARWLFDALASSPLKRDIKISRGTHLMHLEEMRFALYRESIAFLRAGDHPPRRQPAV